jgi:RNA polymerase sigma factor (sigma-70 family)
MPDPFPSLPDPFLNLFDTDPRKAEVKLEVLRTKLNFFFRHHLVAEPEDSVQEVLSRVLRNRPQTVATHDDVIKFCFGVARNIALEQRRKFSLRARREVGTEESPAEAHSEKWNSSLSASPEKEVLMGERAAIIRACLRSLVPGDRDLLLCWYLDERKAHTALADRLGISPNALRIRVLRANRRAADCFRARGLDAKA